MLEKLFSFFARQTFTVNLITVALVGLGIFSYSSLHTDLEPPMDFRTINVSITLPGANPVEIENEITFPVERALKGLPGVKKITSQSRYASANISLHYAVDTDDYHFALEKVEQRVNRLRPFLPQSIRSLQVSRADNDSSFLMWIPITGYNPLDVKERDALNGLIRRLQAVAGVLSVEKEFEDLRVSVKLDRKKIEQFGVTPVDVQRAVSDALQFAQVGEYRGVESRFFVELVPGSDELTTLHEAPLRSGPLSQTVRIKDVAEVVIDEPTESNIYRFNGARAYSLVVQKDLNSDIFEVDQKVQEILNEQKESSSHFSVFVGATGKSFIGRQLDNLKNDALVGILLVMCLLFAFLNFRSALMVALGVPFAYAGTFIVLAYLGYSINLLTIIGLLVVIGILVDDAILITEKYNELIEEGLEAHAAAVKAASELFIPVCGSMLTIIVAFSPMIFIKSEISSILSAIPIVIIGALLFSLFETFFLLPNHLADFVKPAPAKPWRLEINRKLENFYQVFLDRVIKRRYLFLTCTAALFIGAAALFISRVKTDMNMNINSERIAVYGILKEARDLAHAEEQVLSLEKSLSGFSRDDIGYVSTQIGRVWQNGIQYDSSKRFLIELHLPEEHDRPSALKARLLPEIEKILKGAPKDTFEFLEAKSERSQAGKDNIGNDVVRVAFRGENSFQFKEAHTELKKLMASQKFIKHEVPNPDRVQKTWSFVPNAAKLAALQMNRTDLATALRTQFASNEIFERNIHGTRMWVTVNSLEPERTLTFEQLSDMTIMTPFGNEISLARIGSWQQRESAKSIAHTNGQKEEKFDFSIDTKVMNKEAASAALAPLLKELDEKYTTTDIALTELSEAEKETKAWAFKVAVVCIGAVFLVIALILQSLGQAALVSLPIPFCLVGILIAFVLHGFTLTLMAMIGLLGAVGVSVNSSIVLVDQINKNRALFGRREAISHAAISRLRPIVLTTLTTLVGVFPMAYGIGGEAGFTQPLAFSLAWGLVASTFATLVVLPLSLYVMEDVRDFFAQRRARRTAKGAGEAYVAQSAGAALARNDAGEVLNL